MEKEQMVNILQRIGEGIATMFGNNCEVVIQDLDSPEKSIIAIYNGHVTGRSIGGPLSALGFKNVSRGQIKSDLVNYSAKTSDGRLIKCSTFHISGKNYKLAFGINFDCTSLQRAQLSIDTLIKTTSRQPYDLFNNIDIRLGSILEETVIGIGKKPKMMKKADKLKAVALLEDKGIFLINGSMQAVANYLNISRFTLYNYLKEIRSAKKETQGH